MKTASNQRIQDLEDQISKRNFKVQPACDICMNRQITGIERPNCNKCSCHAIQIMCYLAPQGYDCTVFSGKEDTATVVSLTSSYNRGRGWFLIYWDVQTIYLIEDFAENYISDDEDGEKMSVSDFCAEIGWCVIEN